MSDFDNIRRVVQFDEQRDGYEDRPSFSLSDVARLLSEYDRLRAEMAERAEQEPVAVVQLPDPFDDRDGPWFDQKELRVIKQLPAGTKLYRHPPAPAAVPETFLKAVRRLVVAARTSGGTAGPDFELMEASAECEAMLTSVVLFEGESASRSESEAEPNTIGGQQCWKCKGSGLVSLPDDPNRIGTATCSWCGGRGIVAERFGGKL